jgi:hypothetical protein
MSYLSTSKNLVNWPQFLESQCTCHHLQNLIKWVRRLSGLLSCSLMYFWSAIFTNKQWSISIPLLKVASSWVVSLMHHKDGGNGGCANKSLIIITVLNCSIVEVYSIFLHKWGKNCKQGSWISDLLSKLFLIWGGTTAWKIVISWYDAKWQPILLPYHHFWYNFNLYPLHKRLFEPCSNLVATQQHQLSSKYDKWVSLGAGLKVPEDT